MTQHIDPLILRKLDTFSQRRRKLIIIRGICAAAATLLLAMMLVALVDAIFVLPDWARWGLSLAAYGAVIVVEWRASLRLLLHAPDSRRLARLVEHAEPRLREDLLSAVELGETESAFDSEQFRALVQTDVAHRMEGLDMERLLPVNLVRRYIGLGIVAAVICLVAFVLSGLQFGTLLLRALAPGANLARVSRVKVRIVNPESPDKVVAQGETESLVVEISGQRTNSARLETMTTGGREVLKMTPQANAERGTRNVENPGLDRFSATIQVGREDVIYRVFAGDAVTKKFRLHAVARPHVVTFEKTITYPAYVHLEPKKVTEENGDLVALEGSEVELRLVANQQIGDAELRVEQGKKSFAVKLEHEGAMLSAKVPLTSSGTYRVHLVGAETGFENKFSPEYELRAEPDLVPQVELTLPKQDLILPVNEIVEVQGRATDDQGLSRVVQMVKVNEGGWREFPLAKEPGLKASVERRWDLFEQGVKPGDLVTMKLLAVDLKGSRAESRSLRVTVTKSGFEPKRLTALDAYRKLYDTLKALREAGETLRKRGQEAREQFDRLGDADEQRISVAASADSAFAEFAQKTDTAWTQLEATLKDADAGHVGADLLLLGRSISRLNTGTAQAAKEMLNVVSANLAQPLAREWMREFGDLCLKTEQRTRQTEEWGRTLLFTEEMEVIAENLNVVVGEARRLGDLAAKTKDDKAQWAQIANRLRVLMSEDRSIAEIMDTANPHEPGDRMKWARKQIDEARLALEKPLSADAGPALLAPTQNFVRVSEAVARNALENYRDLLQRAANQHQQMVGDIQPTYENFARLREELAKIASRKSWPDDVRAALADGRWEKRGLTLKQHGDLEEMRTASDSYFVSDVRLTTIALDALHTAARADESKDARAALEKNFRLLEVGHNVAETLDGLQHLAAAERWEIASTHAITGNPRDQRWLESRLRSLPDELGKIQSEEPVRKPVEEARQILWGAQRLPAWQTLDREMRERFNPQREPVAVVKEVEQLATEARRALDLLRKPMEEARKQIAALAPKLHEMMAELARKAEELKQKTEEQAGQAAEKRPEQAQADAQQALAQQKKLNERVETLKDALRADANQQDILKDDGRERARDADDALAMLKEPPPKAEQALADAAQAPDAAAKGEALKSAAQEQQKLASALDQLAKHYEKAEKGEAAETRTALRATEAETGIKEAMDQQFARAEELAKMAEKSPEELLKQLEKALPKNPTMQQELSSISRNTLDQATAKLSEASNRENQVARDVQKLAADQQAQTAANPPTPPSTTTPPQSPANPQSPPTQPPAANPAVAQNPAATPKSPAAPEPQANPALAQAAQQQMPIAQAANNAGEEIARTGRHEQRLQNQPVGEKLEALGEQVKATAAKEVPQAGEALTKAQQAAQATSAVNAANEQLQSQLGQLQAAANAPKSPASPSSPSAAASTPAAPAPSPSPAPAPSQAQAQTAPGTPSTPPTPAQQTAATAPANASPASPAPGAKPPATGSQNAAPAPIAGLPPGLIPPMPQLPAEFGQMPAASAGPATPLEQTWMARTLDALDTALHTPPPAAEPNADGSQTGQTPQGQPGAQGQKPGQQPGKEMAQAQQAMNSAAQAAAAKMRASRGQKPAENSAEPQDDGPEQAVSKNGATAQASAKAYGKLGEAKGKAGDWGKLPKQVAEQLTRGQNENVAGEYRNQVETYYRVIAEKSKKP